jgi:predicted nucleotidyltransferase
MQMSLMPERIAAVAGVFRSEPTVAAAWFFGSAARGRPTPFSDLDFAVLLKADARQGLDRFALLDRLARGVASVLGVSEDKVDVAAVNEQGVVFQYQVIRTGQLICEVSPKARELFVWDLLQRYLDFRPTLDIYDRARFGMRPSPRTSGQMSDACRSDTSQTAKATEK